jgi:transposase
VKTGCQWSYLPGDFPPPSTFYSDYRKWMKQGIWHVERTFGWFNWYRRLSKDYEQLPAPE